MENLDVIYGKNSVMEALIAGEREINKILISKNIHSDVKINKIKELAKERGVVFQFVAREKFQPYEEFNHQGAVQRLKDNDWWVIATDASAKDNYYDVKYNDMNFAIIMGAEHAGVSKSLLKASDFVVKIPMQNSFNSLNVSNALSAIIFETLRQKLTNK